MAFIGACYLLSLITFIDTIRYLPRRYLPRQLVGYLIYPYTKKHKRDIIKSAPKFYLFDPGIANYLTQQSIADLQGNKIIQ